LSAKGFAMVRVELADGLTVDVYTLHAEAGGSAEDQRLQAADFEQLAEYMQAHSEGRPIIVGGDTNLHTNSDHPDASGDADTKIWAQFLADTGLTDACDTTSCTETDSIDKIAYRSAGNITLKATDHELPRDRFKDPAGDDLSDHPPLVVTFHWSTS
jgi:endonuclease/exonuclease/phosphatase family metal-dependent hydrolase